MNINKPNKPIKLIKVLHIDKSVPTQALLKVILSNWHHYELHCRSFSDQGIKYLQKNIPNIVILPYPSKKPNDTSLIEDYIISNNIKTKIVYMCRSEQQMKEVQEMASKYAPISKCYVMNNLSTFIYDSCKRFDEILVVE